MALTNGSYTTNTGRDLTLNIISPIDGSVVTFPNIQSLQYQQETTSIDRQRMDGVTLEAEIPKGWSGTIEFDRSGNAVETLFADIQSDYLTSGVLATATMYLYITESGGSQTIVQFDSVSLKLADGGTWKTDQVVSQRITWKANQMIVTA